MLALVACSGADGDSIAGGGTEAPSTPPQRIVSLSPTATEMLFALGAGDWVVAVDDNSNYPPEAPTTDLSSFTPNLEAIIGMEPDVVVLSNDPGGVISGLRAAQVEALLLPAVESLEGTYDQIEELGGMTDREEEAAELVGGMRAEIDDLVGSLPERRVEPTYYHELDPTLYTATSSTFIGAIYSLAGLENIADAADDDASGYPQLSAEYILDQDPDLIFLADTKCCQQSRETLAARPGFAGLDAVSDGRVHELDDDVASRWGPRVVDLLRAVVEATADVPVG